jgi:hypothetical protein
MQMSRLLAVLSAILLSASLCAADTTTTRPLPGITLERIVWTDPLVRFFIVTVDLTNPRIHLKVSRGGSDPGLTPPWNATLMPVSQIAQRDNLAVAINGNLFECKDYQWIMGHKLPYFEGNWAKVSGWAMSDGSLFSPGPVERGFPSLVINDRNQIRIGSFIQLPPDARQVVSGVWQVVTNGQVTVAPDSPDPLAKAAPHTVAGIDRDRKKLILFVVDGRRPGYSIGMQMHQMAEQLAARGVWNALVLDGGGSSTLVMRDASGKVNVLNRPSDGHDFPVGVSIERCVANVLGVVVDPSTESATRPSQP